MKSVSTKRRIYIKIFGIILILVGMIALSVLLTMHGASTIFILIAAGLVLLGVIFTASPGVLAVVLEALSLLP